MSLTVLKVCMFFFGIVKVKLLTIVFEKLKLSFQWNRKEKF